MHIINLSQIFNFNNYSRLLILLIPLCAVIGRAAIDINLSLIALSTLIYIIIKKDFFIFKASWFKIAIILWLYLIINSFFAKYPEVAFSRALPFVRYPLIALTIQYLFMHDKKNYQLILISLTIVLSFYALNGYIQYYIGTDLFGIKPEVGTYIRLKPINDEIAIGYIIMSLMFPLLIYCGDKLVNIKKLPAKKIFYYCFIILFLIGVVILSGERAAVLLMLLGIGLSLILYPKFRKILLPTSIITISLIIIILLFSKQIFYRQITFTKNQISNFTESPYGLNFKNAFDIFAIYPIFGSGVKHYRYILKEDICNFPDEKISMYDLVGRNDLCPGFHLHPHNIYVELLSDTGIIGLSLFLLMIFYIFKDMYHMRNNIISDPIIFGAFIAVCLRLWPIIVSSSIYSMWNMFALWLMLGIMFSKKK